jgi:hypothetical protein
LRGIDESAASESTAGTTGSDETLPHLRQAVTPVRVDTAWHRTCVFQILPNGIRSSEVLQKKMKVQDYENCENCQGYINTKSTAYDIIKKDDGKMVFSHYHHCTRQLFTYGDIVGRVVETVHPH